MGIDVPSYDYYVSPKETKNTKQVKKEEIKIGVDKNESEPGLYKELAKKMREYGIEKIKKDIKESKLQTQQNEEVEIENGENLFGIRQVTYSTLSTRINGKHYKINFVDDEWKGCPMGRYNQTSNKIFININACEKEFAENITLAKKYNWNGTLDLYDFMSGIKAHEDYHQDNKLSLSEEEANAEVKALDVIGEPYLVMRLQQSYIEILNESFIAWLGKPYEFGKYRIYTDLYKRYTQALKTVIKNEGKEAELEKIINSVTDNLKTGFVKIDGNFVEGNGLKKKNFIEKDGKKIRQGYYRNESGVFNQKQLTEDLHNGFATILTPEILKKVIFEYKKLSNIEGKCESK